MQTAGGETAASLRDEPAGLHAPAPVTVKIVSLAGAEARRRQMQAQLSSLPIPWAFFDAHTAPSPPLVLHEETWRRINGRPLETSEIGCYSSHFTLLCEHAAKPDSDILIVLEDDAILDPDFFHDVEAVSAIVREFGYIRLNAQIAAPSAEVKILGRRRIVRFLKKVHGTAGYMIDAKTARRFAAHLKDMYRPIDVEMDRFWVHGIPIYCLYQFAVMERSAYTQIGTRAFERGALGDRLFWKALNQLEKLRCALKNLWLAVAGRRHS